MLAHKEWASFLENIAKHEDAAEDHYREESRGNDVFCYIAVELLHCRFWCDL